MLAAVLALAAVLELGGPPTPTQRVMALQGGGQLRVVWGWGPPHWAPVFVTLF